MTDTLPLPEPAAGLDAYQAERIACLALDPRKQRNFQLAWSAKTLRKAIAKHVAKGSAMNTDDALAYYHMSKEFAATASSTTPRTNRLRHIAGSEWSTKRYLNMELLKDQQMSFRLR